MIEIHPENLEYLFELAQIESYLLSFDKARALYERILLLDPAHERAFKALKRLDAVSARVAWHTGVDFFEADSGSRDNDIRRYSWVNRLVFPMPDRSFLELSHQAGRRFFNDYRDLFEQTVRIAWDKSFSLRHQGQAFYQFTEPDGNLNETHEFGAGLWSRYSDAWSQEVSYARRRLDNNSQVIRQGYYQDRFANRFVFRPLKQWAYGADIMYAGYSDGNQMWQAGGDATWFYSFEPQRLSLQYRYFFRDFDEQTSVYFSPFDFWTHQATLHWRHYWQAREMFFGMREVYYDVRYVISADAEHIIGHHLVFELNYEVNPVWSVNAGVSATQTSHDVYQDQLIRLSVRRYF